MNLQLEALGALALLSAACAPAPQPAASLRVGTLNIANGAGDTWRDPKVRPLQHALLEGLEVAALQEVDVGVERSGRVDTALAVAGAGFEACAASLSPEGLRRCDTAAGTVLFGLGFQGDDLFSADAAGVPGGIIDADASLNPTSVDRSPSALFGNALVLRGVAVESAAVVALPITDVTGPGYPGFANGPEAERAAHNRAVRASRGIEPRCVLVARLTRPGAQPLSVLATHLESGGAPPLRRAQLEATAQVAGGERAQGRQVLLLGDFNMGPAEAAQVLTDAGMVRAVGEAIDQVWIDAALTATAPEERSTDGGSDHPSVPTVTLR